MKSEFDFTPPSLELLPKNGENEETWEIDFKNGVALWEALQIPAPIALEEKMWVALEHRYFLDYTLDQLKTVKGISNLDSRIIFTYNAKRSVAINSLSLLWWSVYYTIDEECESDPYHLTKFFFKTARQGTKMAWLSSNVISSRIVALGILEGIEDLIINGKIKGGRYAFTNANKLVNQVGATSVVDVLDRKDIKEIVVSDLDAMDKTQVN